VAVLATFTRSSTTASCWSSAALPEGDAARALKAKGITGKLTLLDGKTGKPRIRIDIEKMAKLTVREDQHRMRFARWTPMPVHQKGQESGEGKPHSPEEREEAA
jgi:hypothetical protein